MYTKAVWKARSGESGEGIRETQAAIPHLHNAGNICYLRIVELSTLGTQTLPCNCSAKTQLLGGNYAMKKHIALTAWLIVWPSALYCQYYYPPASPSRSILSSGLVLGTERERYFSLRMEALGFDLSGIVEDQLTDLYRNPAYFDTLSSPKFFGDLVRVSQSVYYPAVRISKVSIQPIQISNIGGDQGYPYSNVLSSTNSASPVGLRLGYFGKFGVLVRGNFAQNSSHNNDASSVPYDGGSTAGELRSRRDESGESQNSWGDAQLSYATSLSDDLSLGGSYTFSISDNPSTFDGNGDAFRSNLYFYENDTSASVFQGRSHTDNRTTSNIVRLGLLHRNTTDSWDAVGTVEIFSATLGSVEQSANSYYASSLYTYNIPSLFRFQRSWNENARGISAHVEASNFGLDVQYRHRQSEDAILTAQLGAGVATFSSDDRFYSFSQSGMFRQSLYDTVATSGLHEAFAVSSPDGFGFRIQGGAGWTFRVGDALLAIAGIGNYLHMKYDFDEWSRIADFLTQQARDTVATLQSFSNDARFLHQVTNSFVRIAVPLGLEYEVVRNFNVRAGWMAEFIRSVSQDRSEQAGYRFTDTHINLSTVSFGVGYRISKRLQADFVNYGDIAQPRNWNVSVTYNRAE